MADQTAETDAEWTERNRREAEEYQANNIALNRGMAHNHLRNAAAELRLMDRAVRRLHEDDLFDVEFEGNGVAYVNARALIDVAIAALTTLVPKREEDG